MRAIPDWPGIPFICLLVSYGPLAPAFKVERISSCLACCGLTRITHKAWDSFIDRQVQAALRKTAPEAPETPKTATRRFFRVPDAVAADHQAQKPCAARPSHSSPRAPQL